MNVRCGGGKEKIQWTSAEFHLLYHSLFPISPPPPPPLLLLSLFVPEAAAAGEAPILTLPPPPPIPPPPLPSPLSYPPLSQSSQSQLSHNLGPLTSPGGAASPPAGAALLDETSCAAARLVVVQLSATAAAPPQVALPVRHTSTSQPHFSAATLPCCHTSLLPHSSGAVVTPTPPFLVTSDHSDFPPPGC